MELKVGEFAFTVELDGGRPRCEPADGKFFPLSTALSTCWAYSEERFVQILEERSGCGYEEQVGFDYAEDSPGEVPEGKVRVYFVDERLILDRAFFEEAACVFALAAIDLLKESGRPVAEGLEARLRAVRARGSA
jgi:hypothetical protein